MAEVRIGTVKTQHISAADLLDTAVAEMGGQRRAGQHDMLEHVAASIETGEHLLVQAGTGTGKSLAYLVPLITHALTADKPSVVATATLALQAQIVGRDVPKLLAALRSDLPREIDVALLKGRSNYVCKYKLGGGIPADEPEEGQLFALGEDAVVSHPRSSGATTALGKEVVRLRAWADDSETGDRDELTPGVSNAAWRQVSVTAVECLGSQRCPVADECFSEQARARSAEADIIVTNHAMLAISTFSDAAVLPEHDVVVVDEAHELVDRVTGAVTGQLSAAMISSAATSLRRHSGADVAALQKSCDELALALRELPSGILAAGLPIALGELFAVLLSQVRAALSDSKDSKGGEADGARSTARARMQLVFTELERIAAASTSRDVLWLSRGSTFDPATGGTMEDLHGPATLYIAPLSVAMQLRDRLFGEHTTVMTSATLAIGSAFEPIAGAMGLIGKDAPQWQGVDVGSPFNYAKQGVLYVASHLEKPGRGTSPEQLDELMDLIGASGGGALCLFSSKRAAEEAAVQLRARLEVPILCQGESSMAALIKQFADEPDTCLFGTMSLWQGVDVPGKSCRLVTIDRIPFPRPDDPLMTARAQAVSRNGGNGFMSVSATHAAVRLAQGAGRLIRSSADQGVVAILDSRLATARYGGYLRSALPPFWATTNKTTVLSALARLSGR